MGHRAKPFGYLLLRDLGNFDALTYTKFISAFSSSKTNLTLVTTNYSLTMSPFLLRWWTSLFLCVGLQRMNDKFLEDRGKIFFRIFSPSIPTFSHAEQALII